MTETPLVSIICTVYNKAPWLQQTLGSLLAQETDFLFEVLIVDDASTDHSVQIIQEVAQSHPEQVRVFLNEENQGISKTWVAICQEARGHYIARCDGDDFWLDPHKLQKQLTLLQETGAKWSNTDFDIYDENGNFVSAAGFQNGTIPLADTFEKMLATRGFTMASTWLVERQLMLEVNSQLDLTTSDDTFNLQMDLFQRTTLAYLPEATVAYRINQGSDSRPKDFQKLEHRFNKLLETQNDYLDKYPTSDYREMLRILLERNNNYELTLTQQAAGLEQLGFERVTIYFDCDDKGFNQEEILQVPLEKNGKVAIHLPDNCHRIRIDLSERPSFYSFVKLQADSTQTRLLPQYMNGSVLSGNVIFPSPDPQMIYEIDTEMYGRDFTLSYEVAELNNLYSDDYLAKVLAQGWANEKLLVHDLTHEKVATIQELSQLRSLVEKQQVDLEEVTLLYNAVTHSRRWTIPTKIINFFRRK
ncbi:glycosyltransferase [Streptococcus gallinaceus]|uniref:Glucosyltransferase n=1 Tax=Streptococcus gallinaceus TaxID=165758 RepID=A0ABV2JM41_9STRE|nr:glycosyltransferase family 2 protein [Streptococcus gallinaceus]MCP1639097.1 glucosyltransferase [Streptococcus gallinaceus]MCP1769659.1 glucosyltransferase [Streptococcus gallinaceus]